MGIINILDDSISNIIAAGEVVENPAAMLKEIIENSLDAKSKNIKIYVNSELSYFKILDDGIGMDKNDLLLCIERHATSKIKNKEDIFKLYSYGFRGEALASISAVSKLTITSKEKSSNIANKMKVYAGVISSVEETNANYGTEIEIRDLFYNTPARKKFLKKNTTELSKLKDVVLKEALGSYNTAFELYIDDKLSFKTTGKSRSQTIYEIFGKNNFKNLNEFSLGYLGNVDIIKSTKDYIYCFVNGRYVKSFLLEKAIINAYETKLMKGKYPFCIIYLEIDPQEIDINVDPSKKYIKFSNEKDVFNNVYGQIKLYFNNKDRENWRVSLTNDNEKEIENNNQYDIEKKEDIIEDEYAIFDFSYKEKPSLVETHFEEKQLGIFEKQDGIFKEYNILGQLFYTYIMVYNEQSKEIEIYDQHIIHERILYETLKENYSNKKIKKEQLLLSKILKLTPLEADVVRKNKKVLDEYGFEIDEFENDSFVLRTVPLFEFRKDILEVFSELLKSLSENEFKMEDIREEILTSMSCKGAIKAGDKLTMYDMQNMVRRIHEVGEYTCPHGRPIILKISKKELDKKFGRIK